MTLTVRNRDALQERARSLPVIEAMLGEIVPAKHIRSIEVVSSSVCAEPGWIVLQDVRGRGLGINIMGVEPACTTLRRHIVCARGAHKLAHWMRGISTSGFTLRADPGCPQGWGMVRVTTDSGSFLYAASECGVIAGRSPSERGMPRVALRVVGTVVAKPEWFEQGIIEVDRLAFEIESQNVRGSLYVCAEKGMGIHVEEDSAIESPGDSGVLMRLDLGDIELSLNEVVALRAGSVIELQGTEPLRCYMRVGSTVLAEGEVAVKEDRIVVRVVSTIS